MLQAVHFTHEEGNIVHTDLKPANFLMANGRLKLIDFGIAQKIPVGTIHIKRDAMIGTPNYMAPETVRAVKEGAPSRVYKAGKASDIWAMGCILYQMVYSRPPFEAFHGDDKLREILDPNHKIDFSSDEEDDETELESVDEDLIDVLRLTLTYSALDRVTIPQLLQHPLLRPLEQQHKLTVPMSRTMLRDVLRKMYAFARSGELNEENLDARTDALFDNMVLRRQQME
ncbi:kinase-like protein [Meira miltonrushii]|uniref:Kinase-like protein n=1 Tax=Meira miltonrushii TaxID=1280837 RepID=A0A316V6Y1_9BASI|nr:kinase-like protein [Meira miltonrushii]PWN31963.1 kinase-like protein [Meira miltonrushii]